MTPRERYNEDNSNSEDEGIYSPGGFGKDKKPSEKKEKKNWYTKFAENPKIKGGEWTSEKYKKAVGFLGWKLTPNEIAAATKKATTMALIPTIIAFGLLFYFTFIENVLSMTILVYIAMPLVLLPIMVLYFFNNYPIKAAEQQRVEALTYIPEITNYLVMSMKLTPNLEKAVSFAAEHGRGKIAEDLEDIVWNLEIGKYRTMGEALDELAYRWGEYSEEFKHGLMLIRSSTVEPNDAQRRQLLDKAMENVLEGIKNDMTEYAKSMKQPSIYLYYVGVLLPLILVIMLPIGSMMANVPLAKWWVLILLYNILVPIGTFVFAKHILSKRPPVYVPPNIPKDHPGLPKRGHMKIGDTMLPVWLVSIAIAIAIFLSFSYVLEPMLNPEPVMETAAAAEEEYIPFFRLSGSILAIAAAISIYLYGMSKDRRKVQEEMIRMETGFKDSIYILSSRLGENRPMEEALSYTAKFLGDTPIAKLFEETVSNLKTMGMTMEEAFFDPNYGSLKHIPSDLIKGAMKVVVDSSRLGAKQAARTLVSLSIQLKDTGEVRKKIRTQLEDITAMMKSIAYLIGPLVLGITTSLQRIIINALGAMGDTQIGDAEAAGEVGIGGLSGIFGSAEVLEAVPGPTFFLLIIGVYVVQVTLILIYFTSRVEEGPNNLALKINIAKGLPIALVFYFISAYMATQMSAVMA
ncbi:MAG: hypothetical protein ACOCTT_00080 [archaeon]